MLREATVIPEDVIAHQDFALGETSERIRLRCGADSAAEG
jgi:hypothetical protein